MTERERKEVRAGTTGAKTSLNTLKKLTELHCNIRCRAVPHPEKITQGERNISYLICIWFVKSFSHVDGNICEAFWSRSDLGNHLRWGGVSTSANMMLETLFSQVIGDSQF